MNLTQVMEQFLIREREQIVATRIIPAVEAKLAGFPAELDKRIVTVAQARGVRSLYSHQYTAIEAVLQGNNVVVVTPTASGKTLCYNLPVLNSILADESSRSLYLFPTKALAQDQVNELRASVDALGVEIKTHTYDGDTPVSARPLIRQAGHIVVTNPDMLHTGILPHHTKWIRLFENLRYVVIDEMHHYRGVFGSHVANVIRRLRRICEHYGSSPQFILCSATIANPAELAQHLIEQQVTVVDNDGSPRGRKYLVLYNPPIVNRQLGLRRSSLLSARNIAANLLANDVQTIVFARSRLQVEVMVTYLRQAMSKRQLGQQTIRGYRGGYLPLERREIERGLRQGEVRGVVSTNALELGVDIGGLEAAVLIGYPGSIASVWQQMGRAGRRLDTAAAVFVASSSPLDQFLVNHPEYFLDKSPEQGLINPNNLLILIEHIKCAAFELPFREGEKFGVETTVEILDYLESERTLFHANGNWHWNAESYPAEAVSLRSASRENFVIVDITRGARVIGELDRYAAPTMLHEEAIYLHEGNQYQVEKLDYDEKKAYVRAVDVDYYTDANLAVELQVLEEQGLQAGRAADSAHGEVRVTSVPTMFKKIKFDTRENIGSGPIYLPQEEMHTTAFWLAFNESLTRQFDKEQTQTGLVGIGNLLVQVAPLFLMCDPSDLRVVCQIRATHSDRPTAYVYEAYPGGVGLSERLFRINRDLLQRCLDVVSHCPCESGCPSCVGPAAEVGEAAKQTASEMLRTLVSDGPR